MIEHYDNDAPLEGVNDDLEVVQYFCRFTFGQFFTLIVLLVITVCSFFYLGARYGNQFLRIDGPSPVAAHSTSNSPVVQQAQQVKELPAHVANDAELLELARKALQKEQQDKLTAQANSYLQNPNRSAPVVPEDTSVDLRANAQIGQPQVQVRSFGDAERAAANAANLAPEPKSSPVPVVQQVQGASGLPYSVQVGSYRQIGEARNHVRTWQGQGYPAYMMEAEIPNKGRWYRVRVGAFATRTEAKSYLGTLKNERKVDGIVVTNE